MDDLLCCQAAADAYALVLRERDSVRNLRITMGVGFAFLLYSDLYLRRQRRLSREWLHRIG